MITEKRKQQTYLENEETPSDTQLNSDCQEIQDNEINFQNIYPQPEQDEYQDNEINEEEEEEEEENDQIEAIQNTPIIVENQGNVQGQKYQFINEGKLYEVNEKGQLFKVTTEIQNGQEVQIYEQVGGQVEQDTFPNIEVAQPIIYQNNNENQKIEPLIYPNINENQQQLEPIIESQEIQENQNYNISYETIQGNGQNLQYPIIQNYPENYPENYPNIIQNPNINPSYNFNGNMIEKKEKVPKDSNPKRHLPSKSQCFGRKEYYNLNMDISNSRHKKLNSRDYSKEELYIKKNAIIKSNYIKGIGGYYYKDGEENPTDSNSNMKFAKNKNSITSKPTDKFSLYLLEQINKIRRDPESFVGIIEDAKSNITKDRYGRLIYNGKLKIVLANGESAFSEAINYLKNVDSMKPLEYIPQLTVLPPQNEKQIKDKKDLERKVEKMIDSGIKIKSYWRDVINDPEICCLLMIVDDNGIKKGKKRKDILNPYMKYIGISSVKLNKDFVCYITLTNSLK